MLLISPPGLMLLQQAQQGLKRIGFTQLVYLKIVVSPEIEFFLTTAGRRIDWAGEEWFPAGLGPIDVIEAAEGQLAPLTFTMPGVTDQQKAFALEPGVENATVRVYDALIDPETGQCVDAPLAWSGALDVPILRDGEQAVLSVTAEHRGMLALRPKPLRYTHNDQTRLYPGDTSLRFDPRTDAAPLPWPAASYYRR